MAVAMNVPLLDLKKLHAPLHDEIMRAIEGVVRSGVFIGGPEIEGLERETAAYVGAAHGVGVSSGTDAILAALMAMGIGEGDEVVTTPYSFFATAGCVVRSGAKPVFVDIDPATFNIDAAKIEAALTPKTKAIIPVHLYGQAADMSAINALAKAKGLLVIEDAAQAIGVQHPDGPVGALGAAACFSFFPSKNLGGLGDGGMLTTGDAALAERLAQCRNHGMQPKYHHKFVGGNFRLDAIQAAALRVKLKHLDAWSAARRKNAARYRELFAGADAVRLPASVYEGKGLERPHIYNQFVIRVPKRDALRQRLVEAGVGHDVYYPVPFHLQECFRGLGYRAGDFPESEKAAAETLALPVDPVLSDDQLAYVAEQVQAFYA